MVCRLFAGGGFAQKGHSAQKLLNLHKKGSTGCEQHQSAGPPTRPVSRLAPARWRGSGRLQKRSVEHASRRRGPTHPSAILSEIRRCVASIQLALRRLAACQGYIVNSPNHWLASHNGESLRIGWSRDLRRNAGQRRGCAESSRPKSEADVSRRGGEYDPCSAGSPLSRRPTRDRRQV